MARGRLLNRTVSASLKFHNLSDDTCRLFATWTIAYLDMNGVFYGDPVMLKSTIFPRRADITVEQVEGYLCEMEAQGLLYRYLADGDLWQCWPGFAENQPNLRRDRERPEYPLSPEQPQPQNAPLDGTVTADCRQDDGGNPAEVKLREVKLSEVNAAPRTDAASARPDIAALVGKEYPELHLSEAQINSIHKNLGQGIISIPHLASAMCWAQMNGITKLSKIINAAIGWNSNSRNNGSSPDPPRSPPVIDLPDTVPEYLTGIPNAKS